MRRMSLVLAILVLVTFAHASSARAAVMGTGCWNCRYTSTGNWPFVFVEAQCTSAENGGGGMGISCKVVITSSFLGMSLIRDCEFEGGECMYIEVNGRNERAREPRGFTPRAAKIYLF